MKEIFIVLVLCFIAACTYILLGRHQHDEDIIRLRHLVYYGRLIEEFHDKTGRYPLQEKSWCRDHVHITTRKKGNRPGDPFKHETMTIEDFKKELEKGLGRKIVLKFDPQKKSGSTPRHYTYVIEENNYFFASYLFNDYPFTNPVGENCNIIEITNASTCRRGLWNLQKLLRDDSFQKTLDKQTFRNKWFLRLNKKYNSTAPGTG